MSRIYVLGFLTHLQFPKSFSSSSIGSDKSLVVSYLINSCRLSPHEALSASKRITFKTIRTPDSVLTFLRTQGFTDKQISKIVKSFPQVLRNNPHKTLSPKFDYFHSMGFSRSEFINMFCSCPSISSRSIQNNVIPTFKFLKTVFKHDHKVLTVIKRVPGLIGKSSISFAASNMSVLRSLGMPESRTPRLFTRYGAVVLHNRIKFNKTVQELILLGFDPKKSHFINAMVVMLSMTKFSLDRKIGIYRKWGWSEEDVNAAFRKYPMFLATSENKIMGVMDFMMNKMGWSAKAVAQIPRVFANNLEKRIAPRGLVLKVLQMEGFIRKDVMSYTIFGMVEEQFILFMSKYEEHVPHLRDFYQGKVGLLELGLKET